MWRAPLLASGKLKASRKLNGLWPLDEVPVCPACREQSAEEGPIRRECLPTCDRVAVVRVRPILWSNHQARRYWIDVDIAGQVHQVRVSIDVFRAITTLKQGTDALSPGIQGLGVGSADSGKEPADRVFPMRTNKQVKMVRHQAIDGQFNFVPPGLVV